MQNRKQIIRQTVLKVCSKKIEEQHLQEANWKRVAGMGALGLSIATAGQFAGSHVIPLPDYRTSTTAYTMPVSSETFKGEAEKHGLADVAKNTGNFEPHSKVTTVRRSAGAEKGETIDHAVRGPLDFRGRIVQGAAKEEIPATRTIDIKRFSPIHGIEQQRTEYTSSPDGSKVKRNYFSNNRKVESGRPTDDAGADFLDLNVSAQGKATEFRGDVKKPTPSIAGQSAVAGGLYGAGMLALGALRRRRSK